MRSVVAKTAIAVVVGMGVHIPTATAGWTPGATVYVDRTFDFHYRESVMRQDGDLWGVAGRAVADLTGPYRLYRLRIDGNYRRGSTDYDGQTWGGEPATSEADDRIINIGVRMGVDLGSRRRGAVLYTGLGWRDWEQDLKDGTTASGGTAHGYERGHRYLYLPVGLDGHWRAVHWDFRAGLEWQGLITGEARADFDGGGSHSLSMNDGYGVRLHVGMDRRFAAVTAVSELYWQHWDIDRSDTARVADNLSVFEPANVTRELGLRVGLRW